MKILVTGGAGFIGSAVAKRLSEAGHDVVVVDNFNEYYDVELKRARERELLPGAKVVEADITNASAMDALFSAEEFDLVCHLAAQAGVRYSVEQPEVYIDTNVRGTQLLLEMMHHHGVDRMVFASTSSVYGTDTAMPFTEDAPADTPMSVYAATKRSGELIAHAYHSLYGTEVTCLRFFTVYGPWGRPDMALFKFTKAMLAGEPIDIYNHGDMKRDFTYIDDIVSGFVAAVERPLGYEVINLGHGQPTSLLEFIAVLETELGVTAEKNLLPMQLGDVSETFAKTDKAKELLGFAPQTSVEAGVQAFVAWYRSYHGA
ncbi:SDR family NAD(P)-dependent oxidoreductase [Candidatus Pacebacteria bacterium]|nr:SDR family NAD(P)-dependent oxidoreductase [Candidatus Paceibacterota bacterium]